MKRHPYRRNNPPLRKEEKDFPEIIPEVSKTGRQANKDIRLDPKSNE